MAKTTKTQASATPKLPKLSWRVIAVASLALNAGLIGTWLYLLHYNQFPLIQAEVNQRCNAHGYAHIMHQVQATAGPRAESAKKFAAAALCFVDYDTGKPLDPDSLQPAANAPAVLPARP
jgi:hypothetical protein